MTYHLPDKHTTIETLLETGRRVAMDSSAEHPEDIAVQIACAIEAAAIALNIAHQGSL